MKLQRARTDEAFPVGIIFKGVPKILTGPEQRTEHLPGWLVGLLCPPRPGFYLCPLEPPQLCLQAPLTQFMATHS